MKDYYSILKIGLIVVLIFPQTFDPATGELIKDKKKVEEFDPITGEPVSESKPNSIYLQVVNPKQQGYQDARNNYIGDGTWAVLGGGVSLLAMPPFLIIGAGAGEFIGFLGGGALGLAVVPPLIARLNTKPSRFVVQHSKLELMSQSDKKVYIQSYTNELKKRRIQAIKKGQLGWAAAGAGTLMLMVMMFE